MLLRWLGVLAACNQFALVAFALCNTVSSPVDIVWLLDASFDMQSDGNIDPFQVLRNAVLGFTSNTVMGENNVRQTIVQYAGPVDPAILPDSSIYHTITSFSTFASSTSTSSPKFIEYLNNLTIAGGSRDIAGAIDFIGPNLLTDTLASGRRRVVILVSFGPAFDSLGEVVDQSSSEASIRRLQSNFLAEVLFVQVGDPASFPPNFLGNTVDLKISTTDDALEEDLVESGALCIVFETDTPTAAPALPPHPPLSSTDFCYPLQTESAQVVGRVCTVVTNTSFDLQSFPDAGWKIKSSQYWVGPDPTSIPLHSAGAPLVSSFPFEGASLSLDLNATFLGNDCHLYVISNAVLEPVNQTQDPTDSLEAFAGEVLFNDRSFARLFRTPVGKCRQPTFAPTSTPTVAPRDFNVEYMIDEAVPESLAASFNRSTRRFQSLFLSDYATQSCFEQGSVICGFVVPERLCVDDVLVLVSFESLSQGIPAMSAPCAATKDIEQIRVGKLILDASALTGSVPSEFDSLILHHLLHIIGFGTRWQTWGLRSNPSPQGFHYLGTNGLNGFRECGGSPSERLEVDDDGNHWRSTLMDDELMTPMTSIPLSLKPLSKVSVASLKDLGLDVDVSKADVFAVPGTSNRLLSGLHRRSIQATSGSDILPQGVETVTWTVKPGRNNDLERELAFAKANIRSKAPTPAPTSNSTSDGSSSSGSLVGVIVGVVVAVLVLICLLIVFTWWCRKRRSRKQKPRKDDFAASKPQSTRSVPIIKNQAPVGNWMEKTDENGRTYWLNEDTGEFTYTPVEAFNRPPEREPSNATSQSMITASFRRAVRTQGGDKWSEISDDTGTYWINEDTGEFSWTSPPGYQGNLSFESSNNMESPIRRVKSSSSQGLPLSSNNGGDLVAAQPSSPRYFAVDQTDENPVRGSLNRMSTLSDRSSGERVPDIEDDIESSPMRAFAYDEDTSHLTESLPMYSMRSTMNFDESYEAQSMTPHPPRSRTDSVDL